MTDRQTTLTLVPDDRSLGAFVVTVFSAGMLAVVAIAVALLTI